jgi:hypothetical protein
MAKIFGVLLIVLGVWVGMEIYTKGMDNAFGGALSRFAEPIHPQSQQGSVTQRIGAKVQTEMNDAARRETETGDEEDND